MVELALPKNSQITEGKTWPKPEGATNLQEFRIYRWSPDDGANPSIDTYYVDMDDCGPMVLDGLLWIKNNIDPTLTLRRSCRGAGGVGHCSTRSPRSRSRHVRRTARGDDRRQRVHDDRCRSYRRFRHEPLTRGNEQRDRVRFGEPDGWRSGPRNSERGLRGARGRCRR